METVEEFVKNIPSLKRGVYYPRNQQIPMKVYWTGPGWYKLIGAGPSEHVGACEQGDEGARWLTRPGDNGRWGDEEYSCPLPEDVEAESIKQNS